MTIRQKVKYFLPEKAFLACDTCFAVVKLGGFLEKKGSFDYF